MAVKIKDVAEAADVSIATVSYVLNNSAPVSDETRQRVLNAVKRLGYRPNITARNLKASETRIIGYAWHDIPSGAVNNSVLDRFIYTMARAAESHGYHVLTFTQSPTHPATAYHELIQTSRVDGFILSGTVHHDERIELLMEQGFPFVAFGRSNSAWDFPHIDVDGGAGTRAAVHHLIERGHRRIACLAWPVGTLNSDQRFAGYLDAMESSGITVNPSWIARLPNERARACAAVEKMLRLPWDVRPTAIIGVSDTLALGAYEAIEALGMRVGEDVAVTGFDDDPYTPFTRPALTSIRQPIDEIGRKVIEMLVALLHHKALPDRHMLIAPELIIRDSSRRPF
jgi:DNA-binding LacI/PurR family transcriptional regulator